MPNTAPSSIQGLYIKTLTCPSIKIPSNLEPKKINLRYLGSPRILWTQLNYQMPRKYKFATEYNINYN